jgi:hypothetical protein
MQKINQHTPQWLAKKLLLIGGSEIWSLVWHYKKAELEKFGVNLKKDKPFRSPLAVFIKIRHGVQDDKFSAVNRDFGLGMEPYIGYRLAKQLPAVKVSRTSDFIVNPVLHPLACCSPDGYLNLPKIHHGFPLVELEDFDNSVKINASWGRGASEKKTARHYFNFDAEQGARWQYIFQHQYQMLVMGLKWGVLSVLVPKEKQFDEDFYKGQMLEKARKKRFKELDIIYDLFIYIYTIIPIAKQLILESLEQFAEDIKNDNYEGLMTKDDAEMLEQDKIALGLAFPNRYGSLKLGGSAQDIELDYLLTNRAVSAEAEKAAKAEKLEHANLLILRTRKYSEVVGYTHRMAFDKNGHARFYKLK